MNLFKKNQVVSLLYILSSSLFLLCFTVEQIQTKSVYEKTEIEIDEFGLNWEIRNFSFLTEKTGQFLTSEEFYSENDESERWVIQLYPKGSKSNSDGYVYVSVILKCIKSSRPSIYLKFNINLMNSEDETVASMVESDLKSISKESPSISSEWLIRRSDLLKEIPDDKIIIKCDLKVPKKVRNSNPYISAPSPTNNGLNLFKKSDFSDVTFYVNEKAFAAHRAILGLHSDVFYNMFKNNKESVFHIEMRPEAFYELLRFIYTKEANVKDFGEELFVAAEKYGLPELKELCEKAISRKLHFIGQKPENEIF